MQCEVSSETHDSQALPDQLLMQSRPKSTSIKVPLLQHTRNEEEQMGNCTLKTAVKRLRGAMPLDMKKRHS